MTLAELRSEVRDLIGQGAYDSLFSPAMTDEALAFAQGQIAWMLGMTRVDVMMSMGGTVPGGTVNQFSMPTDAIRIIAMQGKVG